MKKIAIYPGRFQPFGLHHKKVFESLQSEFGEGNVYIVTSNKTDNDKSPFNFAEKAKIMTATGIPQNQIKEVRSPYAPQELFDELGDKQIVAVFVYGAKDAGRLQYTKKDGSQGYYKPYDEGETNLETYDIRGYVKISPTFDIPIQTRDQVESMSGTTIRKAIKNGIDPKKIYGNLENDVLELITNKIGSIKETYPLDVPTYDFAKTNDTEPKTKVPNNYKYRDGKIGSGHYFKFSFGESKINEETQLEKGKKLHIYDFDDTIAKVETPIPAELPDGTVVTIPSSIFPDMSATYDEEYGKGNWHPDFDEFEKQISDATPIKTVVNKLINSLKDPSVDKVTILTARSIGYPVTRYLKSLGLEAYVVPLGLEKGGERVTGQDKANWVEKHIQKGYSDIYFIDDAEDNRTSVEALKDKYPDISLTVEDPATVSEMMMGMMTEPEKKKHAKNIKRLKKDMSKQGDQYMEVPKYLKGTLTRKLYERDLSDKEEKIAKDLPDKEFKKRYGKDWKSVKIATATKIAKKNENFPPYKANQVQQTRYKASDVFTRDVKKAEKMGYKEGRKKKPDPKVGTGKKPKGSGRRLYTDENPSDTISVKFSTRQDIVDTLNKSSFKSKPHKRQSQIINLIHQRVRAALNKAKDPAVKKRLRSGFEYIKKRKETSKRKTQRMKKENAFTKEWWKDIINEILLTEGGAAGHMAHPFNLSNVNSGRDLKDVFEKAADSLNKNPGAVKIDGVNSSIRLVDLDGKKQFVMDRGSKKELDVKGITKDDLLSRFGDGHGMVKVGGEVLDMFNEALPSIKNDLEKLGAYDDPNILFNMEYVSGKTNVQKYDNNFIAIHGLNKIESKEVQGKRKMLTKRVSTEIPYDKNALDSLLKNLEPIAKKNGFEVYGSVPTEIKKKPDFRSALSKSYTVEFTDENKTQSLDNWLNELDNIPENDFIFMNIGYKPDSSTVNRKKVGAVSKQVYLAILNGENIDGLFEDEKDKEKAIQGFVTYLATEKLGDEVLKVLDSPMGSVEDHEGVVIRDKNIADVPFKITGKFILGGLATGFR